MMHLHLPRRPNCTCHADPAACSPTRLLRPPHSPGAVPGAPGLLRLHARAAGRRAAYRCQGQGHGHAAAARLRCVALCLRFGADVHAASLHDGKPLLFFASAAGASTYSPAARTRSGDPNVRCHDGTTPLHATAHGQACATPYVPPLTATARTSEPSLVRVLLGGGTQGEGGVGGARGAKRPAWHVRCRTHVSTVPPTALHWPAALSPPPASPNPHQAVP